MKPIALSFQGTLEPYLLETKITRTIEVKRPAIIVCPGGAYCIHATKESMYPVYEFNAKGYHCFLLKYTLATQDSITQQLDPNAYYPNQVVQLLEAIHCIKKNADNWGVDANAIYAMGFSAGGHICASYSLLWNDIKLMSKLPFVPVAEELKIKGVVLGYPFLWQFETKKQNDTQITKLLNQVLYQTTNPTKEQYDKLCLLDQVSEHTIPMFIWHSIDDPVVDAICSTQLIERLQQYRIPCEYHLYGHGTHGRSLANAVIAQDESEVDEHLSTWIQLAHMWMKRMR